MMEKYYTPDLFEFYSGFEFEMKVVNGLVIID